MMVAINMTSVSARPIVFDDVRVTLDCTSEIMTTDYRFRRFAGEMYSTMDPVLV